MLKFVILVIIILGGIWIYNNVDFQQLGNSSLNTIKEEKTINKFHSADKMNKDAVNDALRSY